MRSETITADQYVILNRQSSSHRIDHHTTEPETNIVFDGSPKKLLDTRTSYSYVEFIKIANVLQTTQIPKLVLFMDV